MPDGFAAEVYAHRADLLRIAWLQLRDEHLAEDVVQETFLAALKSGQSFAGKSKLKTWLIGILKFKIVDALRSRARDPIAISHMEKEVDVQDMDALFDEQGLWRSRPRDWDDPAFIADQQDFLRIMDLCLEKLPPNTARVFILRELFEMESEEICGIASISPNHLGVLLYRARMSLRRIVRTPMLNCREASHLLSDALDRALRPQEQSQLKEHLEICPNCKNCRHHFLALRSWKTAFLAEARRRPTSE